MAQERSRISYPAPTPAPWEWVGVVRNGVEAHLAGRAEELRYVATLAASELAENVVKYGEMCAQVPAAIEVDIDEGFLRVRSVNCVRSQARLQELIGIVEEIARATDPAQLYLEQIEATLRDPDRAAGRLGFYRVAAEGGMRLSQAYEAGRLTITAERALS
jgi:hypothetical protein